MGADLTNTVFENCIFKGEEVCFYKAKTGEGTIFRNCKVEDYSWCMYGNENIEKMKKILSWRGLDGKITIC